MDNFDEFDGSSIDLMWDKTMSKILIVDDGLGEDDYQLSLPGIAEGGMSRILIVDDEENIRLLYKDEFEEEGYRVSLAGNAEEALKKFPVVRPDVIILDIRIPGMDGIEFLRKLKEENDDIPVILCSAFASYKLDFRVWACDSYVIKSADLTELKHAVKQVLHNEEPMPLRVIEPLGQPLLKTIVKSEKKQVLMHWKIIPEAISFAQGRNQEDA